MYIIRSEGKLLDRQEVPNFVKQDEDGTWVSCPQWEATALAVNSKHYSVFGQPPIMWPIYEETNEVDEEGNPIPPKQIGEVEAPLATAVEYTDAEIINQTMEDVAKVQDNAKQYEDILLEMDMFYAEQLASLEEVILELDASINE